MFGANIKTTTVDDHFGVFVNITTDILSNVNSTQYYAPSLSFILVLYTYYIIGEGKIWKHLLHVTFYGFVGAMLTALYNSFKEYFTYDYVLQIKWIEAVFWHLNEYGYVYISYLKLRTVVNVLQKKYWDYIMKVLFVYNLIVRYIIAAANVIGRTSSAGSHLQGLTFLPLALVEAVFMFLIIRTFVEQSRKNSISGDIISTMLTSSLTRMFLVGLIYFIGSIVCFLYAPPILKALKNTVWRAKAALGLIFLLDLLFIRINLKEKMGYSSSNHKDRYYNKISNGSESNNNIHLNMNKYNNDNGSTKNGGKSKSNNNYTYFNGSLDKSSKFTLSSEPIVVRMDNNTLNRSQTSTINVSYGPYGSIKPSEVFFNHLKN
ncbi:hypothetical protein U3516DRAFT_668776 [Neocallimastix sp. 'constans']|jgi:hypothetical protein